MISSPPPLPISTRIPTRTRWDRVLWVLVVVTSLYLLLHEYPPGRSSIYPPCLLHRITGLHCPGCGVTRATYDLLHGKGVEAARNNLLFVCALPWLGYFFALRLSSWLRGHPLPALSASPRTAAWVAVAVVIFGILRNIPAEPFLWLSPP
jgi:Protein of unknown function (DUF2752)